MAHALGKNIDEVMTGSSQGTPHRLCVVWQYWLREHWEELSTTDHYLMVVAAEVRRGNTKHPNNVKLDHFKLKWQNRAATLSVEDQRKQAMFRKSVWLAAAGIKLPQEDYDHG